MAINHNITRKIAEDILRQKTIQNNKPQKRLIMNEKVFMNNIKMINNNNNNIKHIQKTLDVLNNPLKLISILKESGIDGLLIDFIIPMLFTVNKKSFLPLKQRVLINKNLLDLSRRIETRLSNKVNN